MSVTSHRLLILGATEIAATAPKLQDIITIVEETYRAEAAGNVQVPPKLGVHLDRPGGFLHAMPARAAQAGALGVKWVSYAPGNHARGLPDSSALILLNDPETGLPVAMLDGMWITLARTAAAAAVAARHLARPNPRRLGLVGCGPLAAWSLRMLGAEFPSIREVYVASLHPETRAAFCDSMSREGPWHLVRAENVRQAVADMDIIVTAVPKSVDPPIAAEWWSSGALFIPLDVVASWKDELLARASRIVCDGLENLQNAMARFRQNLRVDRSVDQLQSVVSVNRPAVIETERSIVFITGIASLDMVVARLILRHAIGSGRGTYIDL